MPFNQSCFSPSTSIIACGFRDCCSSQICISGTNAHNGCSNQQSVNVNVTYWRIESDCDGYHGWNQCPIDPSAKAQFLDYPQGCCKNETRPCPNCPQGLSIYPLLLSWETDTQTPPATSVPYIATAPTVRPTLSSAANTAGQFGGVDSGSSPPSYPPPTSFTAQSFTSPASGLGSSSTRTPVGLPVSKHTKASNTASVAGGVTGGIVAIALLLAIFVIYHRWRTTGPLRNRDQKKFSIWGSGQARPIDAGAAELQEIKQGPSPSR